MERISSRKCERISDKSMNKNEKPEKYELSDKENEEIDKLFKEKYASWDWNYGNSPQFNYKNYKKFPFGAIEVRLHIKDGKIDECKFFGDFFGYENVEKLEEKIIGKNYREESIKEALDEEELKEYFGDIEKDEFIKLLFE